MPEDVLLLSSAPPAPESGWMRRVGGSVRVVSESDTSSLGNEVPHASCVVVDGDSAAPLELARSARRNDPHVQVIVVVGDERRTMIQRQALFHPGLGELWVVSPDDVTRSLADEAADVTRRRRRHARTTKSLRSSLPPRRPRPPVPRFEFSDAFLARLLDVLPEPVFAVTREGTVLFSNRASARVLGLKESEISGRSIASVVRGGESGDLRDVLEQAEGTARVQFRRVDGEVGTGELLLTTVESVAEIVRAVVLRDRTEEERAVAELDQVRQRLAKAERMASLGSMAAGVAHEINNPLSYLITNLDVANDTLEEMTEGDVRIVALTRMKDGLADARDGADRIRRIVSGLMLFSRVDEDEGRALISLPEALRAALAVSHNQIKHRARIETSFGHVPDVLASEARLVQVFVNLLVNAADALPVGAAGRNVIRVATETAPSGEAVVEVTDSGDGMPPHVAERVFEPFYTTKPPGRGTGLGLAISHGIVTGYGGTIEVDTEAGVGTTLRVTLPAGRRAASELPQPGRTPRGPPQTRGSLLVIDDEPLVGASIERLLRDRYDVTVVRSGREAIELVRGGARFDVVLCDVMMPELTGVQLHQALCAVDDDMAKRVVFMTGGVFDQSIQDEVERTGQRWIAKPIRPQALFDVLASVRAAGD